MSRERNREILRRIAEEWEAVGGVRIERHSPDFVQASTPNGAVGLAVYVPGNTGPHSIALAWSATPEPSGDLLECRERTEKLLEEIERAE